jgi:SMC interacting uncharacterized protein involved in chromosome segregation
MDEDTQEKIPEDYVLIRKRILNDYLATVLDLQYAIRILQEDHNALLDYVDELNRHSEEHMAASSKLMERHRIVEEQNKILLQENHDLLEAAIACGVLKTNDGGIN